MRLLPLLLGCAPGHAADPAPSFTVDGVPVPTGDDRRRVVASTQAHTGAGAVPFGYHPLALAGQHFGDTTFGMLLARDGHPLHLCESLDYTGLWRTPAGMRMITHFECQPGGLYLSSIDTRGASPVVTDTRPLDLVPVDGGGLFCAGSETPWDTHIAGEEYEGDVRKLKPDGTLSDDFENYNSLAEWWGGGLENAHPYDYGWMLEVTPEGNVTRRWAMGRFSHELGVAMPDRRTVYMTDDATDGVLFRFVADTPGDLSAGTLYAARGRQRGDDGARIEWVDLGHATDAEIAAAVAKRPGFDDVFETDVPGCVDTLVNWGRACLKPKAGLEVVASRVEARRYAAVRGATTEWLKTEGLTWDGDHRRLLLAVTRVGNGMLAADPKWDLPGHDDIRLAANSCGVVLAFSMDPHYAANSADVLVAGVPANGVCSPDGIANPDNLAWIDGLDLLAIAEDTSQHENNALWLLDGAGRLTRALTAPLGAEVSGLRYTVDDARRGWLSVSVQHPFEDMDATEQERQSAAGVMGPFPVGH